MACPPSSCIVVADRWARREERLCPRFLLCHSAMASASCGRIVGRYVRPSGGGKNLSTKAESLYFPLSRHFPSAQRATQREEFARQHPGTRCTMPRRSTT